MMGGWVAHSTGELAGVTATVAHSTSMHVCNGMHELCLKQGLAGLWTLGDTVGSASLVTQACSGVSLSLSRSVVAARSLAIDYMSTENIHFFTDLRGLGETCCLQAIE